MRIDLFTKPTTFLSHGNAKQVKMAAHCKQLRVRFSTNAPRATNSNILRMIAQSAWLAYILRPSTVQFLKTATKDTALGHLDKRAFDVTEVLGPWDNPGHHPAAAKILMSICRVCIDQTWEVIRYKKRCICWSITYPSVIFHNSGGNL